MENKGEKPDTGKKGLKNSKAFWIVIYVIIAAMLLTGVYMVLRDYVLISLKPYEAPPTPAPAVAATPAPTLAPEATPAPTPEPTPYVKRIPVHIYFPSRKLDADIYPVGLTKDNAMDTLDSATDAAWYEDGPSPGEPGNALLNGHVHWKGTVGTFSILKEMKAGEPVVIKYDNDTYKYFTITSIDVYLLGEVPPSVMSLGGESRTTLITCLGDYDRKLGTSRSRVVAVCKEDYAEASDPSISALSDQ